MGVIKRYYQHRDTQVRQRLGDLVGELYLCENESKAAGLFKQAEKALLAAGVDKNLVGHIVGEQNVEGLAEVISELF